MNTKTIEQTYERVDEWRFQNYNRPPDEQITESQIADYYQFSDQAAVQWVKSLSPKQQKNFLDFLKADTEDMRDRQEARKLKRINQRIEKNPSYGAWA